MSTTKPTPPHIVRAALSDIEDEVTQAYSVWGSLRALSAMTRAGRQQQFEALNREDLAGLLDTLADSLATRLQRMDELVAQGAGRRKLAPKR